MKSKNICSSSDASAAISRAWESFEEAPREALALSIPSPCEETARVLNERAVVDLSPMGGEWELFEQEASELGIDAINAMEWDGKEILKGHIRSVLEAWPEDEEVSYVGVYQVLRGDQYNVKERLAPMRPLIDEVATDLGRSLRAEPKQKGKVVRPYIVKEVNALMKAHPRFGAEKIRQLLALEESPTRATVGRIMDDIRSGRINKVRNTYAAWTPEKTEEVRRYLSAFLVEPNYYLKLKEIRSELVRREILPRTRGAFDYLRELEPVVYEIRGASEDEVQGMLREKAKAYLTAYFKAETQKRLTHKEIRDMLMDAAVIPRKRDKKYFLWQLAFMDLPSLRQATCPPLSQPGRKRKEPDGA